MRCIAAIAGAVAFNLAVYQGLAMSGTLERPPIEGILGGLIPAVCALLAGILFAYAFTSIPHEWEQ